jgi:hypothetical protein
MAVFVTVCAMFTVTEAVFFQYPALGMAVVMAVYAYKNYRRNQGAGVRKM